ncbi:MAG: hypothetical protein EYC69_10540 [Bacteroidetes bacterium]|nr:MAG: hypothetical protein EYC69_10540 [Bacteroidota bacterium]
MSEKKLPIGYYLKKVDNLISDGINRIHMEAGLTRTDWQILNSIIESENRNRELIANLLSEFETSENINNAITRLINNDLLKEAGSITLTDAGNKVFKSCLEKQLLFRQKSMEGISDQEYLQLISTLEKIIENIK